MPSISISFKNWPLKTTFMPLNMVWNRAPKCSGLLNREIVLYLGTSWTIPSPLQIEGDTCLPLAMTLEPDSQDKVHSLDKDAKSWYGHLIAPPHCHIFSTATILTLISVMPNHRQFWLVWGQSLLIFVHHYAFAMLCSMPISPEFSCKLILQSTSEEVRWLS